uniref:Amphiphysin n=1 Tax=Periophthalmus magnuspinnatus TaxID=409849 RepID=A0A3B4ABU0_9GOBI
MAEIKTGIFAKNVQKRINRAQEKVLQKLGKADETKDEQFEQVVINFRRQEVRMQQASINLTQSLHEVYEPDWHGKDDVVLIGKDCDALWEDFHNKIVDSTLLNLDAYLTQFPDLKTRVAKRSRKLIDYDSARHHMETLQAQGLKNDRKMIKAEEELKKAQRVFEDLNVGLQDELPTLWDSRVQFYIDTFKSVTILEAKFHREISLVCRQLYEVMTKLAEQHPDKMFNIQGAPSDSGPLRLARTPSPPEDDSPPESPEANHRLRPVSPGPPRPKSPIQVRPRPGLGPGPKMSPPKEEPIIDLFGGDQFPCDHTVSAPQFNERPGESLLDLDLDAFQVDETDLLLCFQEGGAPAFFADFDKMVSGRASDIQSDTWEGHLTLKSVCLKNQDQAPLTSSPGTEGEGPKDEGVGSIPGEEPKAEEWPIDSQELEPSEEPPEKMAIPSVVIEPASSNEGDDDRDADIISPTVVTGNTSTPGVQHIGPSDGTLPHDFLYKVETMHDFEAANSDELELSRGDVVLVVPTVNQEDQEAGWLTGIKLSDWSSLGVSAQRGLFPENFVQQLD